MSDINVGMDWQLIPFPPKSYLRPTEGLPPIQGKCNQIMNPNAPDLAETLSHWKEVPQTKKNYNRLINFTPKMLYFYFKTIQSSRVKLLPVNIIGLSNFVFIGEAVCSTSFKFVAWEKKQFSFISFWFVQAKKLFSFAFSPLKSPFSPKVWKLFILLKKLKASKFSFVDFWRNNSGSSNSKVECFSL